MRYWNENQMAELERRLENLRFIAERDNEIFVVVQSRKDENNWSDCSQKTLGRSFEEWKLLRIVLPESWGFNALVKSTGAPFVSPEETYEALYERCRGFANHENTLVCITQKREDASHFSWNTVRMIESLSRKSRESWLKEWRVQHVCVPDAWN